MDWLKIGKIDLFSVISYPIHNIKHLNLYLSHIKLYTFYIEDFPLPLVFMGYIYLSLGKK